MISRGQRATGSIFGRVGPGRLGPGLGTDRIKPQAASEY